MNEVPEAIFRWLEQKRRTDRASAAVISVLALGGGTAVFLLIALLVYAILTTVFGAFLHSVRWLGLVALGLTGWVFVRSLKSRQDERQLGLDPMGLWIFKDIFSAGPGLILEGLRQVRCCGELGELNVTACGRALAYLAGQDAPVNWEDVARHCSDLAGPRLKAQLSLLDGVLFLGEDGERVTLMDPFRLRLRWLLGEERTRRQWQESAAPRPEPAAMPVNAPENLSAYEILGLSPSASMVEIKKAYRKRMKECHPDLFARMDQSAKALAERWTRALNAAYATLNPRQGAGSSAGISRRR